MTQGPFRWYDLTEPEACIPHKLLSSSGSNFLTKAHSIRLSANSFFLRWKGKNLYDRRRPLISTFRFTIRSNRVIRMWGIARYRFRSLHDRVSGEKSLRNRGRYTGTALKASRHHSQACPILYDSLNLIIQQLYCLIHSSLFT